VSDDLYRYYNTELSYLRMLGGEFAKQHPKIAARLNLGRDASRDPHVERLLQGVAFLNARLHQRLDDDFPELCNSLLDILYPHFLSPVPSMSVVQMAIAATHATLKSGYDVPRGTVVQTEPVEETPCFYQTSSDLKLWPLQVAAVKMSGPPFLLPKVPPSRLFPKVPPSGTATVVEITIETLDPAVTIGSMDLGDLRFYLHSDADQPNYQLYEWLFTRCLGVVLSSGPGDPAAVVLEPKMLRPVGFEAEDAALPVDARCFPGYRLLTEFFAMPEKFLFFSLDGLTPGLIGRFGSSMTISILLSAPFREFDQVISGDSIRLGCTPIVNVFRQQLDPMRIDGSRSEYCITPDARRPRGLEIYRIESVQATFDGEESLPVPSIYSFSGVGSSEHSLRWSAARRPNQSPQPDGGVDRASDVWLSLIDQAGGPTNVTNLTVNIEALCTNRNLPERLPFSADRPGLSLRDGQGPVGSIVCLVVPTPTLRHSSGHGSAWHLLSHLSLNHLSLVDNGDDRSAESLRQILGLYLYEGLERNFEQKKRMIRGISRVSSRRISARLPAMPGRIEQGLEVMLQLDRDLYPDRSAYLLCCVLDRFLGAWVEINSFTRLVASTRQQENRKEQWTWPSRAGNRTLV